VYIHVDEVYGAPGGCESRRRHGIEVADEGDDAAVVTLVGLHIQQPDARGLSHGVGQGVDNYASPSLAEIGHAFDDLRHASVCFCAAERTPGPPAAAPRWNGRMGTTRLG